MELSIGLLLLISTAFAGGQDALYIDPLIQEVFAAEGEVDVLVKLRGAELPENLPEKRVARGKTIATAREKQFAADKKALLAYMRGRSDHFQIIMEIPRSLTVVVHVSDGETLAQLKQFQRIQSLHYAHRPMTSGYSTEPAVAHQ